MKLVVIITFVVSSVVQSSTIHRDAFILYVEPAGETFTQEEQQRSAQYAQDAADYWIKLSPITTTVTIVGSAFITTTDNVLDDPYGLIWSAAIPDGTLPIIIIDNSDSGRAMLGNTTLGLGSKYSIFTTSRAGPDIYAHEYGHALYDLSDQPVAFYDIMNGFPLLAYDRHMIGCDSLAELGKPCTTIVLPIVSR